LVDFGSEEEKWLIEGDGFQHFEFVPYLHNDNPEEFEAQVKRDIKVNRYAEKKGYRLLRITYYNIDRVPEIIKSFFESEEQIVFSDLELYEATYALEF
jgi:very-short-patch-repair endonuclease